MNREQPIATWWVPLSAWASGREKDRLSRENDGEHHETWTVEQNRSNWLRVCPVGYRQF